MNYSLQVAGRSCVVVGRAAEELPNLLPQKRIIVFTDRTILALHPELFAGREVVCMEQGEEHKSLQSVEMLCRELVARNADRSTFLLGVGGGIVTDITGFVASIYMRGIAFGFVSTTLLGNVDASVGGKNGVNFDGYKNMIGVFAQPQFVICDTSLLATLPPRELRAGLAEAIKSGIIGDATLFELIEQHTFESLCRDEELLSRIVLHSVKLKADIVSRDEREAGERRKLNLGHTFAHAIEKCTHAMNHGEAVAVGIDLIAQIAHYRRMLPSTALDRIHALLLKMGFEVQPPVPLEDLLKALTKDKKSDGNNIHVVMPTDIGRCTVETFTHDKFAALACQSLCLK
jgi:3-dehydroquinate synthase